MGDADPARVTPSLPLSSSPTSVSGTGLVPGRLEVARPLTPWARRMLGEHVTFELGTWTVATGSPNRDPARATAAWVPWGRGRPRSR